MAMVTSSWLDLFQNVNLKNIFVPVFDHKPILLRVDKSSLCHVTERLNLKTVGFLNQT